LEDKEIKLALFNNCNISSEGWPNLACHLSSFERDGFTMLLTLETGKDTSTGKDE
jgi:hypothetical protein